MIEFFNVDKDYSTQKVIKDLSLHIRQGEIAVLVGPSGCGKTTILKMINKLIQPTSGEIRINQRNIKEIDATELRRQIGYVIQQTGLFPHMTVEQNVGIILKLQKKSKAEIKAKTISLLEMVGLNPDEYLQRYPSQLSGGQLQRIGVARSFATDPQIILMDEPFSALDPITRSQLQKELKQLNTKLKKTIVFVTHDIDEAIRIADRICIINGGNVEQFDTVEEILVNPATKYVEKFIGAQRIWHFPQFLTVKNIVNTALPTAPSAEAAKTPLMFHANEKLIDILPILENSSEKLFFVEENGRNIGSFHRTGMVESILEHIGSGDEA